MPRHGAPDHARRHRRSPAQLALFTKRFAWFVCLFTGKMPEGMRNVLAYTIRCHAQTQAYYSLVTPRYPSLNVGLE